MSKKTFLSLSNKEHLQIAPKIYKNSDVLYGQSKCAAQNGHFGLACSLSILGTEELIKAIVVHLKGEGANVYQIEEFRKVFSQHKVKHDTVMLIKGLMTLAELVEVFESTSRKKTSSGKVDRFYNFLVKLTKSVKIIVNLIDDHGWWEGANDLKNNGLYVGYINNELLPQDITEAEYNVAHTNADKVVESVRLIKVLLNRNESKTELIDFLNEGFLRYIPNNKRKKRYKF